MKSIIISIKPEWIAKILNGEKTIEIRRAAPRCEFPITVYIYCTKSAPYLHPFTTLSAIEAIEPQETKKTSWLLDKAKWYMSWNGTVVAKFTLNGVDKFTEGLSCFEYERLMRGETDKSIRPYYRKALQRACLTDEELRRYAPDRTFYAWHIEDLVIFEKPRGLSEFGLEKAPRSWCFVEEEE